MFESAFTYNDIYILWQYALKENGFEGISGYFGRLVEICTHHPQELEALRKWADAEGIYLDAEGADLNLSGEYVTPCPVPKPQINHLRIVK